MGKNNVLISLTDLMTKVFGQYCEQRFWLHVGMSGGSWCTVDPSGSSVGHKQWGMNSVDISYNLLPLPQASILIPSLYDLGQVTLPPLA